MIERSCCRLLGGLHVLSGRLTEAEHGRFLRPLLLVTRALAVRRAALRGRSTTCRMATWIPEMVELLKAVDRSPSPPGNINCATYLAAVDNISKVCAAQETAVDRLASGGWWPAWCPPPALSAPALTPGTTRSSPSRWRGGNSRVTLRTLSTRSRSGCSRPGSTRGRPRCASSWRTSSSRRSTDRRNAATAP